MCRRALILVALILIVQAAHGDSQREQEIEAADILEMLARGEAVNISYGTVLGDLNFIDMSLMHDGSPSPDLNALGSYGRSLNSTLSITGSTFLGRVDFRGTRFQEPVNMSGSVFKENVVFTGAEFNKSASFNDSQFENEAQFGLAEFKGPTYFQGADFKSETNFGNARFNGSSNFGNSAFKKAIFTKSVFKENAYFSGSEFQDIAWMNSITFEKEAHFDFSLFLGKANFKGSIFNGSRLRRSTSFLEVKFLDDALFGGSRFAKDVTFQEAHFLEDADFQSASFRDDADFQGVSFRGDAIFWEANFNRSLYLGGAKFSRFKARWQDLQGHLVFGEILFQSLIKNFKDMGRTQDANDCYYEYRVIQSKDLAPWPKLIDTISWLSCGYSVRPSHTVLVCLAVILLFGSFFWLGKGIESIDQGKALPISATTSTKSTWHKVRDCYALRCLHFSTGVFIASKPADYSATKDYRYIVMAERILGWFFFGLFVATLTRTLTG